MSLVNFLLSAGIVVCAELDRENGFSVDPWFLSAFFFIFEGKVWLLGTVAVGKGFYLTLSFLYYRLATHRIFSKLFYSLIVLELYSSVRTFSGLSSWWSSSEMRERTRYCWALDYCGDLKPKDISSCECGIRYVGDWFGLRRRSREWSS